VLFTFVRLHQFTIIKQDLLSRKKCNSSRMKTSPGQLCLMCTGREVWSEIPRNLKHFSSFPCAKSPWSLGNMLCDSSFTCLLILSNFVYGASSFCSTPPAAHPILQAHRHYCQTLCLCFPLVLCFNLNFRLTFKIQFAMLSLHFSSSVKMSSC